MPESIQIWYINNPYYVSKMSDWLIVGAALIVAILFLVYKANKEP